MNIGKALKKIDKLSPSQLQQALQMAEEDITRYKYCIRNYSDALMQSHGLPYLRKLEEIRNQFLLKQIFGR